WRQGSAGNALPALALSNSWSGRLYSCFPVPILASPQDRFQGFDTGGKTATLNRSQAHTCKVADAAGFLQPAGLGIVQDGLYLIFDQSDNVAGCLKPKFNRQRG